MTGYRDLVFYQKSQNVVKGVNELIKTWPKTMQSQIVSHQLFRSSTSVGANIAEGHGRHQGREYIHYLTIAQGSANEVDHWLHTAIDCQFSQKEKVLDLIEVNNEVRKMLSVTIRTLEKRLSTQQITESPIPYTPIPYSIEDID